MTLLAPFGQFLGNATLGAANTDIGPVRIPPGYGLLTVTFFIASISASQMPGLRFGTGTTTDAGLNYSRFADDFSTTAVTGGSGVSQSVLPIAQAASLNARSGNAIVHNPSGQNKTVTVNTSTYSAASPTAATAISNESLAIGAWFNTGQAMAVSLSANGAGTMGIGSYLSVYGIPGTG